MNDVSSDLPAAARPTFSAAGRSWAMGWIFVTTLVFVACDAFLPATPIAPPPELYRPLQAALELITIVVSAMLAALGWHLRDTPRGTRFARLGAAFLGVALIDLGRLVIFPGTQGVVVPYGGESATGLWLMARAFALVGLFGLVVLPRSLWTARAAVMRYVAVAAMAGACLWVAVSQPQLLLRAMRPEVGPTPSWIGAAFALALVHAALAVLLYRRGRGGRDETLCWIGAASWVLALSVLMSTPRFYISGVIIDPGLVFQLLACVMIYRTLFVSGVRAPRETLAGERALLRALIDSVPDPIAFRDPRGAYLGCNDAFAKCYGRPEHELVGRTDAQIAAQGPWGAGRPDGRERPSGSADRDEAWVICNDGHRRLFDTVRIPFRAQGGFPMGEIGISRDITDLRWIEEQLAASERRLALALESAALGLWDWHVPSGWVSYDDQWLGMLGLSHDELEPTLASWEALVHPDDWPVIRASLEPHLRGETPRYTCEHRLRHKDGRWVWVLAAGSVIERDEEGAPIRVVGIHQDISPRKTLEERLVQQATSDPLTGLANRRHFDAVLANEMARVKRHVGRAAVVLLDLDHFKRINDRWGHAAGDEVLKRFTGLVAGRLRDSDVFARLGGEEFAILLPGVDLIGAFRTAERLRRVVASVPVVVDDAEIPVTVSIGVATLRAFDPTPASALARADEALYRAKDGGRNRTMMEEDIAGALTILGDDVASAEPAAD